MHKRTNKYFDKSQPELQNFSNNDQNREEDKMRLYHNSMTEEKEAELEEFVADMQEKQNFIDLINEYSKKYESTISTSERAIIIL